VHVFVDATLETIKNVIAIRAVVSLPINNYLVWTFRDYLELALTEGSHVGISV